MERAGIIALRHATGELAPLLGVTLSITVTPDQIHEQGLCRKSRRHARRHQLPDAPAATQRRHDFVARGRRVLRHACRNCAAWGSPIALANFTLSDARPTTSVRALPTVSRWRRTWCRSSMPIPYGLKLVETTIEQSRVPPSFAVTVPDVQRKEEATQTAAPRVPRFPRAAAGASRCRSQR